MILNFFKRIVDFYVDSFKLAKQVDKRIWILLGIKTIVVVGVVLYILPGLMEK